MAKDAVFTIKLESGLRDAFIEEAEATERPASQLVREFMRAFIEGRRGARKHDAWFRAQVRAALDDPYPGIPHEEVMDETRALIDQIAASQVAK